MNCLCKNHLRGGEQAQDGVLRAGGLHASDEHKCGSYVAGKEVQRAVLALLLPFSRPHLDGLVQAMAAGHTATRTGHKRAPALPVKSPQAASMVTFGFISMESVRLRRGCESDAKQSTMRSAWPHGASGSHLRAAAHEHSATYGWALAWAMHVKRLQ